MGGGGGRVAVVNMINTIGLRDDVNLLCSATFEVLQGIVPTLNYHVVVVGHSNFLSPC